MDPEITLENTMKTIRQKEVKERNYILQGNDNKEPSLKEVKMEVPQEAIRPEVRSQYIERGALIVNT